MHRMIVPQALTANAALVFPAEKLYDLVVSLAHSVLKGRHRIDQLVPLEGLNGVMRLQVSVAVRDQTDKAGFQSLTFPPLTEVTGHIPGQGRGTTVVI